MKTLLLLLSFVVFETLASPYGFRRSPQRTVMFGGYYDHPLDTRSYTPQGSMTFASGDTIATNSFVGDAEDATERRVDFDEELEVETSTPKLKRIPKRKQEDSDEDETPSWPFAGRSGVPSYNAFFPIMFGGMSPSGRKAGDSEGYYPGSATAIANSFSTGKGGVATSHATSYGDPYMSTLFRNGGFNRKGAKPSLE
ncbi:uncharacterized protein LOC123006362 [Tribolium madens]|uniref:uncharacterized protein LOC123006362 n=1 Tax=Tribolium madens TaxID=41895 RepID=UPI001CF75453|nr:uncharacterized protein LOC123006362 [Tribolium madens]